ncbi:MAG: HEAT repeat domain-containing protein [Deltaproteobacteria bacterium]|nr:HEAT repeat domain-containing protein [Deltaproteobacteria bacterium]
MEAREMPAETDNYATILIELIKAVKMHNFYPQGHPQLESVIEKSFLHLKKSIDKTGELKWRVDQRGFYFGKVPFGAGNPEIGAMAKKLFFRKVKEIAFTPGLRPSDLKVFISAVNTEPEEIQAGGGVEAFFARHGIEGILLNEQHYEDIKKLKAELKDKEEEKAVTDDHAKKAGASEQSKKEEEEKKQEEVRDEPLHELVTRLKAEDDPIRYNDLAVRIREKLELLLIDGKTDEAFPVLIVFHEHSEKHSGKSDAIVEAALEKLKGLLTPETRKYLAAKAGSNDEANRWAVQGMLLAAGSDGANALLDEIITAPEAAARRNLFNALVLFGPELRPLAEARLEHPEWYVTRQMAALLGEIGGEEALPALEAAYNNPEPRVKKEVLKSMVKIGGGRVTDFMVKVLSEDDQSIVAQAIISLGALKDASAVDALKDIAFKREGFAEPSDAAKEAVKALGMIGDPKAVPHLRKILSRKVWFGRKANEEMRSMAALSLGMIGTPEAIEAVEDVFAHSAGELFMACKRVLDGRGKER